MKLRKGEAHGGEAEHYVTPAWVTRLLLESGRFPRRGRCIDAGSGRGGIAEVLDHPNIGWVLVDKFLPAKPWGRAYHTVEGDFVGWARGVVSMDRGIRANGNPVNAFWADAVVSNPPFSLAEDFVRAARLLAPLCAFLLPLPWFGGDDRANFFKRHKPASLLLVPHRIQFVNPHELQVCPRCNGERYSSTPRKEGGVERGHCNVCPCCHDTLGTKDDPGPCTLTFCNGYDPPSTNCECGRPYDTQLETCERCDGKGTIKASSPAVDHAWWIWDAHHRGPTTIERLPSVPPVERLWPKPKRERKGKAKR